MTALDYLVLLVLFLSVLLSAMRGFVREALALASWVAAFWAANRFALVFAGWLPASIPGEAMRMLIGFVAVFLAVLIVTGLLSRVLAAIIKGVGLGAVDRFFGVLFGIARGVLIVVALTLIAGMTSIPQADFWKNAKLRSPLESTALTARSWLPAEVAKHIRFVPG